MDKNMDCFVLSSSMVHVQSVGIMPRHHSAAFGRDFIIAVVHCPVLQKIRELVIVLPRGYRSSLPCNLTPLQN